MKKQINKKNIIYPFTLGILMLEVSFPAKSVYGMVEETKHVQIKEFDCENDSVEINTIPDINIRYQDHIASLNESEDKLNWFRQYKELKKEYLSYYNSYDMQKTIYETFSDSEINYMLRAIETECFEADFVSKTHVASVILNRISSDFFSDDPIKVITTKNQFCYGRKDISEETILALEFAFEIGDTSRGALFFHSNKKSKTFCGADYIFTDEVGHHFFCLNK